MRYLLFLICISVLNNIYANVITTVEHSVQLIKNGGKVSRYEKMSSIKKVGQLSKVTTKSLSISKNANIQDMLDLAVRENRITFAEKYRYLREYNNMKEGDKILLICLRNKKCNMAEYTEIVKKSDLHKKIAMKYPYLNLQQTNHKIGLLNENMMNKYFQSSGWTKIEGEVGRNGIDGLFIKKKNGKIVDVLIVESKYNKSGLQHTNNGQQMTKQWISKKIKDLQKKYPDNENYKTIEKYIEHDNYRSLLWNLKTQDNKLVISLKKIHDRDGKVITKELVGGEKMKINFKDNQTIDISNPNNKFHKQIIKWYKDELNKV